MIRLEQFCKDDYQQLISWIDSAATMMQFAGPQFSFPLTATQLDESAADINRFSYCVKTSDGTRIAHAEIFLATGTAFIGKILIGNQLLRGKGLGREIVKLLCEKAFVQLQQVRVDLNVFDWNTAAIRCYQHCGFELNPAVKAERYINGETWTVVNMFLTREKWEQQIKAAVDSGKKQY